MNPQTDPAIIQPRRALCWQLRQQGKDYREIGEVVGISYVAARKHVKTVIAQAVKETIEDVGEWLHIELSRIETAINALWPAVLQGETESIKELRGLISLQSDLLGLKSAVKIAPTTPDGQSPYAAMSSTDLAAALVEAAREVAENAVG